MLSVIIAALAPALPDLLSSIGGALISPVYDFIKKKFIGGAKDTPESTLGTLAATKPEVITPYIEALVKLKQQDIVYFNRDVVGSISVFVSDLRAAIRPITVIISLAFLFLDGLAVINLETGARCTFELCVTSWMGDRFTLKGDK